MRPDIARYINSEPQQERFSLLSRIRNTQRTLLGRKPASPTITVEVVDGVWNAEWQHMSADDAVTLMHGVADAVMSRQFAQSPCSNTVH